jgi:hypothetical protein
MIKTNLEGLLEVGLHALNIPFSRRMYGEEVYAGASVDDSLEEVKSDDVGADEDAEGALQLCHDLLQTPDQYAVKYDDVPFFKRRTEKDYNGFIVKYEVFSTEKLPVYEDKADSIIVAGKIESEGIEIRDLSGDLSVYIEIPADGPINIISVKNKFIKKYFDDRDLDGDAKVSILNQISGKKVSYNDICKAVINFIG